MKINDQYASLANRGASSRGISERAISSSAGAEQLELFGRRSDSQRGKQQRELRLDRQVSSSLLTFQGFEARSECARPVPAQLAGRGASFGGPSEVQGAHRAKKMLRRVPKHGVPNRVSAARVPAVQFGAGQFGAGQLKSGQVQATKAAQYSTTQHSSPARLPLSSEALSYVFVAVTLACTFLV